MSSITPATTHEIRGNYTQLRAKITVTTRNYAQKSPKLRALTRISAKNCTRMYAKPLKSELDSIYPVISFWVPHPRRVFVFEARVGYHEHDCGCPGSGVPMDRSSSMGWRSRFWDLGSNNHPTQSRNTSLSTGSPRRIRLYCRFSCFFRFSGSPSSSSSASSSSCTRRM